MESIVLDKTQSFESRLDCIAQGAHCRVRRINLDGVWWREDRGPLLAFAQDLAGGVRENLTELDALIFRYAPAWPVSQLSVVDRNVLRIALFELLYHKETPRKSAVNEAVELAKLFGSESSGRFVNGVLGSIMIDLDTGALMVDQPVREGR